MGPSGERGADWCTSLYAAHYPDLVRYGMRRTADMDRSTELAQEVFVVAWQRRVEVPQWELPRLYGVDQTGKCLNFVLSDRGSDQCGRSRYAVFSRPFRRRDRR